MLRSFFRKRRPVFPPPAPGRPLLVIGDVHGRMDLLDQALAAGDGAQIVLVGDYIDRGDDSARVVRRLAAQANAVCLMGNHEEMLLGFLDDPVKYGPRWLRFGGLQTLLSFGVGEVSETAAPERLTAARDRLADAMGADLIAWLGALPSLWQAGNVAVTHAGADPALPLEAQSDRSLRWGHPDFTSTPRTDGLWVVHGHTIMDAATMEDGRIAVDTGAYATGRLSAARLTDEAVSFETYS
ncbi:MAG: metallophosphoesterase [Pseudomonadota bacterium]